MTDYERSFKAEIMHEILYSLGAKFMRLETPEGDKLFSESLRLANSIFLPENISEDGIKNVEAKLESFKAQYKLLSGQV